jgi:hypothetical protein
MLGAFCALAACQKASSQTAPAAEAVKAIDEKATAASPGKIEEPKDRAPRYGDVCCLPGDQRCLKTYDPQRKGISCRFTDPCTPLECRSGKETDFVGCDKSLPEEGRCECADGFCLLHRTVLATGNSKETGCAKDSDCSLDGPTGACHVSSAGRRGAIRTQGPNCKCNPTSKACELTWYDPVPCKDWRDCWYEREPILHPIKPAKPRTKKIEPCKDGELDAACIDGVCQLLHWGC